MEGHCASRMKDGKMFSQIKGLQFEENRLQSPRPSSYPEQLLGISTRPTKGDKEGLSFQATLIAILPERNEMV